MKTLVFDMDGTIADFYGVKNWLDALKNEDTAPYEKARPIYDMDTLTGIVEMLKMDGWKIVITTWLAKGATKDFNDRIRKAKIDWLKKYHFPYDEIHLVKYGTTKADCTRKNGGFQILIDDNPEIRKGWTLGNTIDANKNILKALVDLI